jgi:hypothetical protein
MAREKHRTQSDFCAITGIELSVLVRPYLLIMRTYRVDMMSHASAVVIQTRRRDKLEFLIAVSRLQTSHLAAKTRNSDCKLTQFSHSIPALARSTCLLYSLKIRRNYFMKVCDNFLSLH